MNYHLRHGLIVPVITVLDDLGRVIEEDQRRVIRHTVQDGHGADIVFGVGTTGEWNRITNNERQRIIEIEIDEVQRINKDLSERGERGRTHPIEAWIGVNGDTKDEVLSNLDAAIQLGADAAVIAPLAINDLNESEIIRFFQRDICDLIDNSNREIPIFLYDNADIRASGSPPHIRTNIVKQLSRLPWVRGIKVSASRKVLGNYTKAALHYKLPGEFGTYIGNAMLIFDIYRQNYGIIGRLQEGWRNFLLHYSPPIGVVSGPANVLPREWQKAWRVCWTGDDEMADLYKDICAQFEIICTFNGENKIIACLKYALELDGVISNHTTAAQTPSLTYEQQIQFKNNYLVYQNSLTQRQRGTETQRSIYK